MRACCRTAVVLAALALAAAAEAQVIQPPPRSVGGLFGGREAVDPERTRQELSMTIDLLGGYDDNLSLQGGTVNTDPFAPRRGGTTMTVTSGMNYRYGNVRRGIAADGLAFVNSFRNLGVRPLVGGRGSFSGFTRIVDGTSITGSVGADYQPTFMFSTFGAPPPEGAVPPSDPTFGVTETQSVNAHGNAMLNREWNVRHRSTAGVTYGRTRLFGLTESLMTHRMASASHAWDFARDAGLHATYSLTQQGAEELSGLSRPVDTQNLTLRLEVRRRISRTRRMTFAGGAGAMRVETTRTTDNAPVSYTTPSGLGMVRLDLGRTWAVSADIRRDVSMILGLTEQSFLTTTGSLWAGGNLGRRTGVSFTASYSDGAPHEGDLGSFVAITGLAQLQYALSRCCSLVGSYSYYDHRLRSVTAVPTGFPTSFERNAVRVGMSIWLPLYGTFPGGRRQ